MTSSLASAFAQGFTAQQVLDYLIRRSPRYARQIAKATGVGYTPEQILRYVTKNNPKERQAITEYEEIRNRDKEKRQNITKGTLAATGAALTPLAGSLIANRAIQGQILPALPQTPQLPNLGGKTLSIGHTPIPIPPNPTPTNPNPGAPPNANANPNAQNPVIASNLGTSPVNNPVIPSAKEYLDNLGITQKVDELLSRGNTPESVAALLGANFSQKGKLKGKIDPELLQNIESYAQEKQIEPQLQKEQELSPSIEEQKTPEIAKDIVQNAQIDQKMINSGHEEPKIEPFTPQKNETVSTPEGIGTIKEFRNGQAIVDVDGKLHKVKEEDIEPPEFSEDEIADTYDKLMSIIPEEHRSGFISWAGYDPERSVIGFIPRGGKYEELHNVTPKEAKMIEEGKGVARTSGETREGLWVLGEDTRGGIISQIIWDRKKKKEANEKNQKQFDFNLSKPEKEDRGMKPIFDEMAYARGLSREREKKKKEAERAKKKAEKEREKNEAKKRKK